MLAIITMQMIPMMSCGQAEAKIVVFSGVIFVSIATVVASFILFLPEFGY
jgi:hypothetical protein